MKVDAVDFGGK